MMFETAGLRFGHNVQIRGKPKGAKAQGAVR